MILVSFGTRPEWIKIKPLLKELRKSYNVRVLFTGQHTDLLAGEDLGESAIKLKIESGYNRLDSIVRSVLNLEGVYDDIEAVLVQGDTTSAFAVALAAFHRRIKIIHLEAGLRTYDKNQPYPEEFNRQAISSMADIHLCPTMTDVNNLIKEEFNGRAEFVGNTVLDNLRDVKTSYTNKILVTMHRRENLVSLLDWFTAIEELADKYREYDFVIPLHPNPGVQRAAKIFKNVRVIEPLPHNEFIKLLASSRLVITDSGGLQEEAPFLGKKCIVCRDKTERSDGIGLSSFLCRQPKMLEPTFSAIHRNYKLDKKYRTLFGDGYAVEKVMKVIKDEI